MFKNIVFIVDGKNCEESSEDLCCEVDENDLTQEQTLSFELPKCERHGSFKVVKRIENPDSGFKALFVKHKY